MTIVVKQNSMMFIGGYYAILSRPSLGYWQTRKCLKHLKK